MKPTRSVLLVASSVMVLLLVGGGLVVKVGASENSYRQAVLFAEVLSLVLENYVDPVDPDGLLEGAYEGMLGGLDPNGAFLTPTEVREWKASREGQADPGMSVLKSGRAVQVVAVEKGSSAAEADIGVGDQIRSVNGRSARDLSLEQVRQLLRGESGTTVTVDLLHGREGFQNEAIELVRGPRRGRPYALEARGGVAVLRVSDIRRLALDELAAELDDVRSRGIETLLVDLRNLAEGEPRRAAELASCFSGEAKLRLRDRSGRVLESVEKDCPERLWAGSLSLLVNSATAGAAEALVALLRDGGDRVVYGESTYGLGAEARLYELEDGSGLLVSAALWETEGGGWNDEGVEPDEVVHGEGSTIGEVQESQLARVLEKIAERTQVSSRPYPKAA